MKKMKTVSRKRVRALIGSNLFRAASLMGDNWRVSSGYETDDGRYVCFVGSGIVPSRHYLRYWDVFVVDVESGDLRALDNYRAYLVNAETAHKYAVIAASSRYRMLGYV